MSDYACLKITNGFMYYYIFLSGEVDKLLSLVLDNCSKLLGQRRLNIPVDESKIHILSNMNKDSLHLLTRKTYHSMGIDLELGDYSANPGPNPFEISKDNPNYAFIRKDLKNDLEFKYGNLFKEFDLRTTALVHVASATFREISKLPDKTEVENSSISLMGAYEDTDYVREKYIVDKLIEHIRYNYRKGKKEKVNAYYCAMFTILQSSGYGKSRLMERLGSRIPTFYSSLQKGAGYPRASFLLERLIDELDDIIHKGIPKEDGTSIYCYMNNVSTAVYIYLLRIFYLILKSEKNKSQTLSRYFEIDSEFEKHHVFSEMIKMRKMGKSFSNIVQGFGQSLQMRREYSFRRAIHNKIARNNKFRYIHNIPEQICP